MSRTGPECPPAFVDKHFWFAISSALLYRAAFAPLQFSFLIWLVPALWAVLIRSRLPQSFETRRKHSRLLYLKIWTAGATFWLLSFSWMSGIPGIWPIVLWIIGAFCLALFWVFYVAITRAAIHCLKMPLMIAAPLVWCGLEWLRKNLFFGGFSYASLEHSQYRSLSVIQGADIFGEYGVGMLIVFVGSCLGMLFSTSNVERGRISPLLRSLETKKCAVFGCLVACIFVGSYAHFRLSSINKRSRVSGAIGHVRIALLQGNIDVGIGEIPDVMELYATQRLAQYETLSRRISGEADLVVWPEDTILTWYDFPPDHVPDDWRGQPRDAISEMVEQTRFACDQPLLDLAKATRANLLLGLRTSEIEAEKRSVDRNSAVLVDPNGAVGPRYDKVNLAPFIEWYPFARFLPIRLFPRSPFIAGDRIAAFPIRSVRSASTHGVPIDDAMRPSESLWAAVNICFDSSFPHFVRRQLLTIQAAGTHPDLVINLSNMGSCRYAPMSHLQLATQVFRAVENRRSFLTANNAGFAAWIDSRGRIVEIGEPGKATCVMAKVSHEATSSLYSCWGDLLPIGCVFLNGAAVVLSALKPPSDGS